MNNSFDKLNERYLDLIADNAEDSADLKLAFRIEAQETAKRIRGHLLSIQNSTQLKAFFSVAIQQLTVFCDGLFSHYGEATDEANVLLILEIMGNLKQAMPGLVDRSFALPKAFRKIQGAKLKKEWEEILEGWKDFELSKECLNMAALPFEEFLSLREKFSWFHFVWMKRYMTSLRALDLENFKPFPKRELLVDELLLKLDFNHPRFVALCCRRIERYLERYDNREEQLYILTRSKKTVMQITPLSIEPFYQYVNSCSLHICAWIENEIEFRSRYDHDFLAETGEKLPINSWKFVYDKWNAEQIAFWFKLQMDGGIMKKEKLEDFTKRLSYNCSSANQEHLTPRSYFSKMYSKDMNLITPIYQHVEEMLESARPVIGLLSKIQSILEPYVKNQRS